MEVVSQKRAEMQDNLWLLQTDPDYIHELASYWYKHNIARVSEVKQARATTNHYLGQRVLLYSVTQFQKWQLIEEQLSVVQQQFKTHCANIKPGAKLPEHYDRAISALAFVLRGILTHKATHVYELTFVSDAWITKWEAIPGLHDESGVPIRPRNNIDMNFRYTYESDRILFYLAALGQGPESMR